MTDTQTMFTVRLKHDSGHFTLTTAATDARTAVRLITTAEGAPVRAVQWVRHPPTCDYCDQPATRYEKDGQETPLCWPHAVEHHDTATAARYHTGQLGITRFTEVPAADWS